MARRVGLATLMALVVALLTGALLESVPTDDHDQDGKRPSRDLAASGHQTSQAHVRSCPTDSTLVTTSPAARPPLAPAPVSRTRRLLGVLAVGSMLMGSTAVGIVAIERAATSTAAVTSSEAAQSPASQRLVAAPSTKLPSIKKILATARTTEGSGLERERSKADARQDQRTGELDR